MTAAIIHSLFEAGEAKDAERFAAFFTDGAHYRFANSDVCIGRDAIDNSVRAFFAGVTSLWHEIFVMHEDGESALYLEMQVHYTMRDGAELTLPCADMFRFAGGRIADMRIYMDASPVAAHAGTPPLVVER